MAAIHGAAADRVHRQLRQLHGQLRQLARPHMQAVWQLALLTVRSGDNDMWLVMSGMTGVTSLL